MHVRSQRGWAAALLAVTGLSLGSGTVSGQTPKPEGPALGVRFTLPNGIVVLVAERPTLPIVSVRVAVDAGSVLDPPDQAGLANLTALLLTRGTEGRTGSEIDRAIEFVGGSLEGEGGRDGSTVSLDVLRKDLSLGLDLLADVVTRPTFPAEEHDRQLEELRAAVRREEEDPGAVAGRRFRPLVFPGHPYRLPVLGTDASLQAITRDDVAAFYRRAYRPDRTVVAVVGDVTAGEVRGQLQARLGAWSVAGSGPPSPGPAPVGSPPGTELLGRDLTQATVLLGQATVARTHPDYYPLAVASHLLGGGSSARLYLRVREERGLAYSIYAQLAAGRHGGLFRVEFQSANPRVREVLALVREDLVRLRRERVGDEELAQAKAYLVGSFPLRMETSGAVASLLLGVEQFGLGLDFPARYRQSIEAVTPDDVLRAVRTHWDPDRMSLVVVANLREAGLTTPP
jgi:zinc protease